MIQDMGKENGDPLETGKHGWDRQCRNGKKMDKCTISQSTKIRLSLGWVVCHSDLYCDPAKPLQPSPVHNATLAASLRRASVT